MALTPYKIYWNSTKQFKSYYWGHTDWWYDKPTFIFGKYDKNRTTFTLRQAKCWVRDEATNLGPMTKSCLVRAIPCFMTLWQISMGQWWNDDQLGKVKTQEKLWSSATASTWCCLGLNLGLWGEKQAPELLHSFM
jgi:hypothetical protein